MVTVPPARNASFTNRASDAATRRTQNPGPSLKPPAAVPVTTREQSPSASDTQVNVGVSPSAASYSPGRTPARHSRRSGSAMNSHNEKSLRMYSQALTALLELRKAMTTEEPPRD